MTGVGHYLVFAYRGGKLPLDTTAMTVEPADTGGKPLPPGIDVANHPTIYSAPECTGTLPINNKTKNW